MLEPLRYSHHVASEPLQTDLTVGITVAVTVTLVVAILFMTYVAFAPGVAGRGTGRDPVDADETAPEESPDDGDSTEADVDVGTAGNG